MYRFVVSSSPMLDTTSKLWFARVFMHTPLHLVTSQPCLSRIVWQLLQLQTHLCPTNESTCIETYGEGWQRHKLTHLWFIQLLFFMTICPLLRNHTTPYSRCFLRSGKPWNRTTDYLQSTEKSCAIRGRAWRFVLCWLWCCAYVLCASCRASYLASINYLCFRDPPSFLMKKKSIEEDDSKAPVAIFLFLIWKCCCIMFSLHHGLKRPTAMHAPYTLMLMDIALFSACC